VLRDVLGLRVELEETATTELSLLDGDRVQVFGPGDAYFTFFGEHARGPVALFEVRDERWEWVHARFPDGNLYELAGRRERRQV
jgi:hypothetical protein